jgi:hypothetical protein
MSPLYKNGMRISESAIRARAQRAGYAVRKSRRMLSLDNHGQYMLVDADHNWVVRGKRFDFTLEDIADFLHGEE